MAIIRHSERIVQQYVDLASASAWHGCTFVNCTITHSGNRPLPTIAGCAFDDCEFTEAARLALNQGPAIAEMPYDPRGSIGATMDRHASRSQRP